MILSYFMEYNSSKLFLVSLRDSLGYVRILITFVFRRMIYLRVWCISKTKQLRCQKPLSWKTYNKDNRFISKSVTSFHRVSRFSSLKVIDKMQFINIIIFLLNDMFSSKLEVYGCSKFLSLYIYINIY